MVAEVVVVAVAAPFRQGRMIPWRKYKRSDREITDAGWKQNTD